MLKPLRSTSTLVRRFRRFRPRAVIRLLVSPPWLDRPKGNSSEPTPMAANTRIPFVKKILMLGTLALSLMTGAGQARECKSDVPQAEALLAKARHMLKIKDVSNIEVYSMSYYVETPIAVYPELLEQRSIVQYPDISDEFLGVLERSIGQTVIGDGQELPDLRWSLKIYNSNGEFVAIRLDRYYFGDPPRRGLINDICVTLDGDLPRWLEANFKPPKDCIETVRTQEDWQKCSLQHDCLESARTRKDQQECRSKY